MKYKIDGNKIEIYSTDEFNPKHIFECGQVFAYKKIQDIYIFYPGNQVFAVYKDKEHYCIEKISAVGKIESAINLFDLNTDYKKIKDKISFLISNKDFSFDSKLIETAIEFGYGIRILKQDIFETIISFIFSANNNIKRIINSLDNLRKTRGKEIKMDMSNIKNEKLKSILQKEKFFSFPKLQDLVGLDAEYFKSIGAGYRASYLVDAISELAKLSELINNGQNINEMETNTLMNELIKLKGVGRKVAECVLLFSFDRKDVFPVDTWIKKVYSELQSNNKNLSASQISNKLISEFGQLSGYVQQYLFYYKRENHNFLPPKM
jgi:N-glycosylase/DNA lyase